VRSQWRLAAGVLAVLVVAALGATAAGSASSKTVSPQAAKAPVQIDFWNYWDGNNGKAIQTLVDKFNATHSGIVVKNVTFPWGDLLQKMQAAKSGGDLPEVAAGDIAWMANLHRSGALVDLTSAVGKSDLKDFYPELLKYSYFVRGKLEALPVSTNNLALFYNKDLFKRAGLNPNNPPKTWDQLESDAKKIAGLGGGIQGFEIYTQPGEGLTWQFQPYVWQAGGDYLYPAPKYNKTGFNNAAGRKALGFLVNLIQKDKVTQAGQWGAFDKGQAAMRVDGSWMVGIYKDQAPFSFGTAMLPIPKGGKHATNMGGEQIFVFKTTAEKQAAATTFATWLASKPVQVQWDELTGFMPVRASVRADAGYKAWLQQEPRFIPFVNQQQYARARPPIPQYPDTSDAFSKALEPAFYGRVSVAKALANADRAVHAALSGKKST
jgi:multiple sugar transport system substrate-binding protein